MKVASLPASLVLCLAAACAPTHMVNTPAPAPIAGDRIRYATRSDSTEFVKARMISLDSDSLVYERFVNPTGQSGRWVAGSLSTDSIAGLQVRVGRRGHAGRGAIIGGAVGLVTGIACANEEAGWLTPTPEQCLVGYTLSGLATGALIGALIRSDVWAPSVLPARRRAQPPTATVRLNPVGIDVRLPIRLMSR
jgi:hypothetical protein